ncbi:unnamed protein product [Symbiodinium pilosum]|uniref:Uncharacterized protein n=1 Tax=Symbiodinium pilosum TaxID=2952 RepID=A0A812TUQ3_SYMPI|nr:unnamed protein product [Symbiodinium pilosum]
MDSVRTANVRAYVDSSCLNPGMTSDELRYGKQQLVEARRKRCMMPFTERMEADAECKYAYQQVMDMRQNEYQRQALDKLVAAMRPAPELKEPKVVKHDRRSLYHGHAKASS